MAEFEVKVQRLTIEDHPNADALELARVGNYRAIVRKGQFQTGDLAVYIPEQAVLPQWLISELGLEGKLAGSKKDRVKAVKLRGVLSQGLVYPVEDVVPDKAITSAVKYLGDDNKFHHQVVVEGDDVTDLLGIVKYEPPIPVHMAGEVFNAHGKTLKYDIEDIKKYPDAIPSFECDDVVVTEKIHGTWVCFGWHPDVGKLVCSKGLSAKGLAFKFNENNEGNLYMRALRSTENHDGNDIIDRLRDALNDNCAFYLLGEVYGKGIQDLSYGTQQPEVRFFDLHLGDPQDAQENMHVYGYQNFDRFERLMSLLEVSIVPVLYRGPFSVDLLDQYTSGTEAVSGNNFNMREGIVVRTAEEAFDAELGRMIAKSVSEDYLLRNGGTEYN